MRKLKPGEPDPSGYRPGQFKEWGVYPVRVMRADPRAKPVYGTQFHPEQSPEAYQDGRRILGNFFRLAREHQASASAAAVRLGDTPGASMTDRLGRLLTRARTALELN